MLTRCPGCETHFRVTAEQLKARSGRVRCGECRHVFNALDSLIEEPMVAVAPSISGSPAQDLQATTSNAVSSLNAESETPLEELPTLDPEAPAQSFPEATEAPQAEAAEVVETAESEATSPVEAAVPDVPDWSETIPEPPPPPRRLPWVIGSLVALTAMGLQGALAFRVELATLWPEARPTLVAMCDIADCEVGLPAKVALVGIEASDLYPDTEHAGLLALTATLKNRAPFAQTYPHLELTLTDTADKAIARKVLAPADYLPPRTSLANGMPPNADILVAIGVDPGDMAANGYRLYLFYP
jgi:predicted Zn finger-like uncharacterized protein